MADPSYIVDGTLLDGEAWVALQTATIDPAAVVQWTSTDDGQVGDWSQYMDLVVVASGRGSRSFNEVSMMMWFNNDTGNNYYQQQFKGSGSGAVLSYQGARSGFICGDFPAGTAATSAFGCAVVHIFDINSGKNKTAYSLNGGDRSGAGFVEMQATSWKDRSPITEIDISDTASADWAVGSKFSLFGILPRMGPAAATVTVVT